ncbi:MAG: acylneuraminate cytidylyltransferase family protein [Bauldia sp.]|nr:acylneuraminate cytidylyltransferase family protein [Bauldia sp.]
MIAGERVVAVVPARGGSKAIPLKNLQTVGGVSLVGRAVATAKATPAVDRVLCSTDHDGIAAEAAAHGAEIVVRPEALAGDHVIVKDILLDLREKLRAEGETAAIMVLLEPTAPFREPADITTCLERMAAEKLDSIATFTTAALHPHRAWRITDGRPETFIDGAVPWLPRQQLPPAYMLNGLVYAFRIEGLVAFDGPGIVFGRSGAVPVPPERSLDIDSWTDLDVADAVHRRLHGL